jgi:hypothetical protein
MYYHYVLTSNTHSSFKLSESSCHTHVYPHSRIELEREDFTDIGIFPSPQIEISDDRVEQYRYPIQRESRLKNYKLTAVFMKFVVIKAKVLELPSPEAY